MASPTKPAGKRKPEPSPSEAEMAVYSLLFTPDPTPKERRMAEQLDRAERDLEEIEAALHAPPST